MADFTRFWQNLKPKQNKTKQKTPKTENMGGSQKVFFFFFFTLLYWGDYFHNSLNAQKTKLKKCIIGPPDYVLCTTPTQFYQGKMIELADFLLFVRL